MGNHPQKIRLPRIQTPFEPPSNRSDEIVLQSLDNVLRDLENVKLESAGFNLSGAVAGDLLVADAAAIFVPSKSLPGNAYAVSGSWLVGGDLGTSGVLNVVSSGSISGDLEIAQNCTILGTETVSGPLTAKSDVSVSGNTQLGGTLGASGASIFSSSVAVSGATRLASTLVVTGSANLLGTLGVSGNAAVVGNVNVSGEVIAATAALGTASGLVIDATGQYAFDGKAIGHPQTYTPTNVTPDRSYDANATALDEIADVLGTLIADLQAKGILR